VNALLKVSSWIDHVNEAIGKLAAVLILACVLISATNAIVRKAFDMSSNAWLEIQWYLFSGVFLLAAGYVMLKNAHVRIDVIATRLSRRTNAIIDLVGLLLVTIPLAVILMELSWPLFQGAWQSGERSPSAGGLIRWPVLVLMPLGFALLITQAVSEVIKRSAFLAGVRDEPFSAERGKSDEELLLEELTAKAEAQAQSQGSKA
jgi:TRAP-type mannitol/chloroaromatic compound transport system permease small subunit